MAREMQKLCLLGEGEERGEEAAPMGVPLFAHAWARHGRRGRAVKTIVFDVGKLGLARSRVNLPMKLHAP